MKKIVIKRGQPTFKVIDVKRKVGIKKHVQKVDIKAKQKRGLPGKDGADGAGVPLGGLPGEMLIKKTTNDFDTEWATVAGSDKYYIQSFNTASVITVNHNLAKYPSITVHDSAGDEVEGTIVHNDINTSTIIFSAPFSGLVTCN